jgi:hypothetical protein
MDYLTIALILFAVGVILLAAEILLPTGGIFVVASLLFFALGVGIIFARGTALEAVVAMGGLAVGLPVVGLIAVSAWRRLSIGSILPEHDDDGPSATVGSVDLESLANPTGKTVSPMRPTVGKSLFGRLNRPQTSPALPTTDEYWEMSSKIGATICPRHPIGLHREIPRKNQSYSTIWTISTWVSISDIY